MMMEEKLESEEFELNKEEEAKIAARTT